MLKKYRITAISENSAHKTSEASLVGREIVAESNDIVGHNMLEGKIHLPISSGDDKLAWGGGVSFINGAYVEEI